MRATWNECDPCTKLSTVQVADHLLLSPAPAPPPLRLTHHLGLAWHQELPRTQFTLLVPRNNCEVPLGHIC
ncbi:hypothetical protein Mapa_004832 [Marchantia paleacea]|nr:hypothetical protein Mapa_004832 [Marchantia paleacea]